MSDWQVGAIARALWLAEGKREDLWDNPPSPQWAATMKLIDRPMYMKRAEAFLAALSASGGMQVTSGWLPIDTAPKDGTEIILGAPAQEFQGKPVAPRSTVGHWTTEEECQEYVGDCGGECRCPEYKYHDPYWISWDGGFTEENPPSGWMPLPPPPEADAFDLSVIKQMTGAPVEVVG